MIRSSEQSQENQPKTFRILSSFSKEDMRELRRFLKYESKNIKRLFDFINKIYALPDPKKITYEIIGKKFFKNSTNPTKNAKKLLSVFNKLIEKFLIIQQLEKDENRFQKQLLLAQAYNDYDLPRLFKQEKDNAKRILGRTNPKNLDDYLNQVRLSHLEYFHPDTQKFGENGALLSALIKNLDEYFVTAKIQYHYEVSERKDKLNESHEISMLFEVKKYAFDYQLYNKNANLYFLKQLEVLQEGGINDELFENIKTEFFIRLPELTKNSQRAICVYLINYTIKAISLNRTYYAQKQLELFQTGFEMDILSSDDKTAIMSCINVAILAVRLQKPDWLNNFITNYKDKLNTKDGKSTINLMTAFAQFGRKDFELAGETVNSIHSKNHAIKTAQKSLEVKILFELFIQDKIQTSYDSIMPKLISLENWLKRSSKFSIGKQKRYSNYFRFLRRIGNIHDSPNKGTPDFLKLELDIKKEKQLVQKEWLLEKVGYLT